jgi:hypothetical protein
MRPALAITIILMLAASHAFAAETKLEKLPDGKWQLLRDGQPFLIKGVGGSASKQLLKDMGGNSFRTWNANDIDAQLDEARKLGLLVTVGVWLEHERHGFNYNDADMVAAQLEKVRKAVTRYKDHPAVLMWAIGNEMEGYGKADNAAVWATVNNCAALAKKLDPSRPTMTIVAEVGGDRVKNVHRLCPDVDILGINSYAGAASVVDRYLKQGGTKPVVITEFGPVGTWEVQPNAFGALVEPTSTQKAEMYRNHYAATAEHPSGIVVGTYAFTWGAKQEATATWFGMLLRDGTKVNAVDALSEKWTGRAPANRCPAIEPIKLIDAADGTASPGQTIEASVAATDPDGDTLTYEWVLQAEVEKRSTGGDHEDVPPIVADAIATNGGPTVRVALPKKPGGYRLYVYIRDGKGSAATANVPLLVRE